MVKDSFGVHRLVDSRPGEEMIRRQLRVLTVMNLFEKEGIDYAGNGKSHQ